MKLCSDMETTNCWDPVFIIKARKKARYKNLIEVLDEMKITRAKKYAVSEFGQKDSLIWLASGF